MGKIDRSEVRRRRVFYIPGYDPIHPRRYRELYRKEGVEQARISGYELSLSPRAGNAGRYGWTVQAMVHGARVDTEIEVLVWSDIVRDSMSNSIPATYLQLVRTARAYIGSGALWRLMRLRKGPVIAALYPIAMLLLQLVLALGLGHLAGQVAAWALGHVPPGQEGTAFAARQALQGVAYLVAFLGVGLFVLRWFRARDNKLFAYYLMHDYAYSAQNRGANPPELEQRMAQFGDIIAEALRDEVDEVLVVGHSSGAHLAVSILADLVRDGRVPGDGPALGFLSLGQVVPMVSFLPEAWRLRRDLAFLSASDRLTWVDVTAPGDGCAFALCDPVAVSGVAPDDKRWPLVFSAAFTQTLSPERWQALKRRYFRLHFQYLCAFDRPKDYDYFLITAGPETLAARYRDRPASKSRIARPVSKYSSVTP